jgi:murein DD-endopeptidase MepM/ murein hydrolase activator NlpD
MRYRTYRYNSETCQYERVKLSAGSTVWYCLGLTVMACGMLVGILLLHDLLVNTTNETRLRKENRALRRHHATLTEELNELHPVLTSLEQKDRVLHTRLFGSEPLPDEKPPEKRSKQRLLLADAGLFREHIATLESVSEKLRLRSAITNHYYGDKIDLKKSALDEIRFLPTLQPIQPWQADRLISGYGMRVNPFHKGLYDHPGVDIAMPRGTPVVATASGIVTQVKRSDLQAGYGNYIDIDHGNGVVTRYAHLEDISVNHGSKIIKGAVIGTVGTSGGSVAPHLHYEIICDGKNTDPVLYMVQGLRSSEHHLLTIMSHQQNQSLD